MRNKRISAKSSRIQCPECKKRMRLSIDEILKPFICEYCAHGPLRIARSSSYIFGFGIIAYFVAAVACVVIWNLNPDDVFSHRHTMGSNDSVYAIFFLIGFYVWCSVWPRIWCRTYANLSK